MKVKYKVRKTPVGEWVIDTYHVKDTSGHTPVQYVVWLKTHWFDDWAYALEYAVKMAYGR